MMLSNVIGLAAFDIALVVVSSKQRPKPFGQKVCSRLEVHLEMAI